MTFKRRQTEDQETSQTFEPIWYYDGSATIVLGHGLHHTPQGYEPQTGTNKTRREQDAKCTNCGYDAHKSNEVYPAKGQICRKCNKLNHFQRVCRSKSVHEVKSDQFQSEESDLDSDFYVDTVNTSFSHYDQAFATVNIGPKKTPIKFKIDTGSHT